MVDMETIVSLCKRRGFIFQSSEIYGGFGGFWDYGPLGVELKNNVKRVWWRDMMHRRDDMVGLDCAIVMNPRIWEASGHVEQFSDPMVDCRECKRRFRADDVPDEPCSVTGGAHDLTEARQFNLMFKTYVGPVEDEASTAYLRPETAQGIFANFDNVLTTMRKRLPFGIAQIGKAFRNEITPGNFIFRDREFEQMEIEFFVKPEEADKWLDYWVAERFEWYVRYGIRKENLRLRQHGEDELAHYSKACWDIECNFPMGWSELEGIANRGDYDLTQHTTHSGKRLEYLDPETKEHIMPYIIEPSAGVDRTVLAFIIDAYHQELVRKEKRTVLRLHHELAPVKVAVLPLARNRPPIVEMARKIAADLRSSLPTMYDDTAGIGRLYRRQDEIGTPFCVTVDYQSALTDDEKYDGKVTIRERDSMEQVRVDASQVVRALKERLGE